MKHIPLGFVLLLILLPGPYVVVQMCPDSVTQRGSFWPPNGWRHDVEVGWVTPSIPEGLFRHRAHLPFGAADPLFRASLLANRFYFAPIAYAQYRLSGRAIYTFL